MPKINHIRFRDMSARNREEWARLAQRRDELTVLKTRSSGVLRPELQKELDELIKQIGADKEPPTPIPVVDPYFLALSKAFLPMRGLSAAGLPSPKDGLFTDGTPTNQAQIKALAAVFGLLQVDNLAAPKSSQFQASVSDALAEYSHPDKQPLFDAVLEVVADAGKEPKPAVEGRGPRIHSVDTRQWVAATRALADQGVQAGDPNLELLAEGALESARRPDDRVDPASIDIDLPDLEERSDIEIVASNLHAMQAIYFGSMLEDLRVFQVVERLVELFNTGMLPLGRGKAGSFLYRYWKSSNERLTELERRNLYARAFGSPGGEADTVANREFSDLWMRFVSAVSSLVRQTQVDNLLRANLPARVSQEQVRKAGRDLAANLSLHGYGIAYFAATEIQKQVVDIIDLLSDPEVKTSFGARDMWQVIDQVSATELGGPRNSIRYRTMAVTGSIIIRWLAERRSLLASAGYVEVIDLDEIRRAPLRVPGHKATTHPTDFDLVNACEQWLAVTGTSDISVEEYSQSKESPVMTSRPISIPGGIQDLVDSAIGSVGISAGLGAQGRQARTNGHTNGHANGRHAYGK